jgi:hypothetical protein
MYSRLVQYSWGNSFSYISSSIPLKEVDDGSGSLIFLEEKNDYNIIDHEFVSNEELINFENIITSFTRES